jgi:DNA-binding NarL/FixJ family response regulator
MLLRNQLKQPGWCVRMDLACSMADIPPHEELRTLELLTPTNPETHLRALPAVREPLREPNRLALFAILTPREKTVLAELMEGREAETIARRSWVPVSTVRLQIKSILQKLGVNSQLAAAAFASGAGWSYPIDEAPARPLPAEDEANDNNATA